MMPQLRLLPWIHSLKRTLAAFQVPPDTESIQETVLQLWNTSKQDKNKAEEGEGKIQAKSDFQVSNSIYTYISHTVVSVCQDLTKLTAKQSDRNKDNLILFVKDREIDVKIVLYNAFSEMLFCIWRAFKFYNAHLRAACLQISDRLIQRTYISLPPPNTVSVLFYLSLLLKS